MQVSRKSVEFHVRIAVCEKTAGLRCGKFSDLNSACLKVLVPIKIFQFQDMLNENRFLGTFRGHSKRPTWGLQRRFVPGPANSFGGSDSCSA
jgi:hypothetical protein